MKLYSNYDEYSNVWINYDGNWIVIKINSKMYELVLIKYGIIIKKIT